MRELRLKPQARRILMHLEKDSISPMEALIVHGIYRLSASIHELRKEGFNVFTKMHKDASGKKYARYHYAGRMKATA
ncbi:Helix-turn-helix domain containing protein [uncultured Caudovirales phage]|uniref:Helix-turn-helix domain containing protein n=1 Tax=uncultured Caudovirales phage TaxID=2100421 RepID=A0A6J5PFP1_9CAUD|nr:Helix-turn-helix domain containing protein [uncultured Caudovirales phage]CAB4182390.1 Helix-turn-helix domain containing protein [uncultured Caudovirales phage]CAB5228302.1 Helix-turn-helix domain containing protein [uncultured Caudovirales phage]